MFGLCKLLFVLLCFVFHQNVIEGSPVGEQSDGYGPPGPPVDDKWKLSMKQLDTERLKLKQNNGQQGNEDEPPKKDDEPAPGDNKDAPKADDDKKDEPGDDDDGNKAGETNGDDEKKEDENEDGKGEDGKDEDCPAKKLKDKKKGLSFMMEDMTASLNWPLGIIPYHLDSSVFDFIVAYNLRKAMDLIESVSCIQFKTLMLMPTQNTTWINITNPAKVRECVHEREEKQGEIVMVLGFDCMKQKQILHTLLHAIGFKDEVTHPLRDQYIHIIWDNIQPKYLHLFRAQPNEVAARTMYEYDPASIMHFHDRAYSKNGQATIQPLLAGLQIGPTDTLSALDKLKLRTLFGRECNKRNLVGLQESCKKVISRKLKSPKEDDRETLKFEDKSKDKKKDKNKKKVPKLTQSMEERQKKREELKKDDVLRTSEENNKILKRIE